MSYRSSNADMETSAPMFNDIVNNALFHSVRRCIKSFTSCTFSGGLVAELCPKFCSQLDWCQGCSAATNLEP